MNENEIMVSVVMIAYNHERYIRKALESVVNQKTNFKFEIIIHDDASPDRTADIIKEYEKKYPDLIRPIYQKENQFSKKIKISDTYITPLVKGRYYAYLECDDYWTDEYKLQKQVDFLEANPEIVAVSHRYEIIDENDQRTDISHKHIVLDRFFDKEDALCLRSGLLHPSTILYRANIIREDRYLEGRKKCCILGGHTFLIYYLANKSDIYIMSDIMSAWRRVIEKNGTSYASRSSAHPITYGNRLLDMYCRYRDFFKEDYNFNSIIREMLLTQMKVIIVAKENGVNKWFELCKAIQLVKLADIFSLPYYEIMCIRKKRNKNEQ